MVSAVDENSIRKLSTKHPFETSLHHDFPPKSKRPKVYAFRQYPSGYTTTAIQTTRRTNEEDLGAKLSDGVAKTKEKMKTAKVDAFRQYPSGYNAAAFQTTQKKNEDDLGAKLSDRVFQTTEKMKTTKVDALCQYPSGYNAAAFQTTSKKNEDNLGSKLSDGDDKGSLGCMCHPGQSSTGVSSPTINQRKGEGDSMACAKAGGGSCTYAKPLKNANQTKNTDALTSLASMSQSQSSINLCSPRIETMKTEEDPFVVVAVKCSNTLVQPPNTAAQSKQINAVADSVNSQALVHVPEYVSVENPQSKNQPVKQDGLVVLEAGNSVSFSKRSNLGKGVSIAEAHMEVNVLKEAQLFQEELQGTSVLNCPLKQDGHEGCSKNGLAAPSTDGNEVMDALNLFKVIVTKLSKELDSKPSLRKSTIYVEAAMLMKKQQQWINTRKQFGAVTGVNIGYKFQFRVELVIIGLHCCFQSGIDYTKNNGQLLATSIVASGRYGNDMESSDVIIYSGQGGNPFVGNRRIEDQKLERGNLALYNSMLSNNPIRVIRGFNTSKRNLQKYTYFGLYVVDKFWSDRGKFGKLVFQFQLKRIPGQPRVTQSYDVGQSEFDRRKLNESKSSKECSKGLYLNDMSQSKEKMPIRVVNIMDNEKLPSFEYMTNMIYPEWCRFSLPNGCDCLDGCSEKCPCALKNGGELAFNNNGDIVEEKPLVYECGPSCKCSSACYNRSSQHGIQISLEVFKTESKGWGVRSRSYIPSGSFVCEYVGELLLDKDAEGRIGNDEYLFDIGHRDDDGRCSDVGFTIDAAQYGNVARFINHSCSPNLFAQNVLYDHDDRRAPHIMLFAAKNMPPLRELTYDYNYVIGNVCDSSGNVKIKNCYCGSLECNGRMY